MHKISSLFQIVNMGMEYSSGATSSIFLVHAKQYVPLHARVNTVMAHRDIQNLERRNILFVSMHFMMMKRLKNVTLAALLLDEEERNEDTVLRTQSDNVGFAHDFIGGTKKAVTTIFL